MTIEEAAQLKKAKELLEKLQEQDRFWHIGCDPVRTQLLAFLLALIEMLMKRDRTRHPLNGSNNSRPR